MTISDSPVSSPLSTCYGGRVAENGVGYRLVAMPPKTGFIECIRLAQIRQVAFLNNRAQIGYRSIVLVDIPDL